MKRVIIILCVLITFVADIHAQNVVNITASDIEQFLKQTSFEPYIRYYIKDENHDKRFDEYFKNADEEELIRCDEDAILVCVKI